MTEASLGVDIESVPPFGHAALLMSFFLAVCLAKKTVVDSGALKRQDADEVRFYGRWQRVTCGAAKLQVAAGGGDVCDAMPGQRGAGAWRREGNKELVMQSGQVQGPAPTSALVMGRGRD